MRDAPDDVIAAYARDNHLVLVTRDFDFADIRNYPPSLYQGIVVLKLQEDATAKTFRQTWTFLFYSPMLVGMEGLQAECPCPRVVSLARIYVRVGL